jgi:hypothetical protein
MLAVLVMARLLAKCPNCYGVFDLPLRGLKLFFTQGGKFTEQEVSDAIQEIAATGSIRLYRDGRLVWIVNKYKRDKFLNTAANRLAVAKDLAAKFPEVVAGFAAHYGADMSLDSGGIGGTKPPLSLAIAPTSDPEPEPDPEVKRETKVSLTAPRVARRRSKVASVPELERVEAMLNPANAEAWQVLKAAMDGERVHKSCKDTVKAAFLVELLASAKQHGFTVAQVTAGMLACAKASNGVAENERYFRKAAQGYQPEAQIPNVPTKTDYIPPDKMKNMRQKYDPERGFYMEEIPEHERETA